MAAAQSSSKSKYNRSIEVNHIFPVYFSNHVDFCLVAQLFRRGWIEIPDVMVGSGVALVGMIEVEMNLFHQLF